MLGDVVEKPVEKILKRVLPKATHDANLAGNGYFAHARGEYAQALEFYEKSFTLGDAPDSAYWGAACDAAMSGQGDKALAYLSEAVERGYDDREQLEASPYLASLRETAGWKAILEKL